MIVFLLIVLAVFGWIMAYINYQEARSLEKAFRAMANLSEVFENDIKKVALEMKAQEKTP